MFSSSFFSGLGSFDFSNKETSCFLLKTLPLTKWLALTLAAALSNHIGSHTGCHIGSHTDIHVISFFRSLKPLSTEREIITQQFNRPKFLLISAASSEGFLSAAS